METNSYMLKHIPQVDQLLRHPALAGSASHSELKRVARAVLGSLREAIQGGLLEALPDTDAIARSIAAQVRAETTPGLRRLINATGVILHTNLGRAPLAESAVEAVRMAAGGYASLEYDVETGGRGSRQTHVHRLLTGLTGAEDALVVNNNAAAVLLMLTAVAGNREVVISRGELVEIGGAFRIPDIIALSGCALREVGTTNRTYLSDYEAAVDASLTGALLKVHTSNYRIVGFATEVSLEELAQLGRRFSLPVLCDLGSAALLPGPSIAPDEPSLADCLQSGVDVVSFSADKLLGGPQAGILLGKSACIGRMKKHPLARAMRIDKLSLAALEATLRLYGDSERAMADIPVLRMLHASQAQLREKAARLAALLTPLGEQALVAEESSPAGGGALPARQLPGAAVALSPRGMTAAALEARLRGCATPIISRISHSRVLLDVRTIEEADFPYIADCLLSILGSAE